MVGEVKYGYCPICGAAGKSRERRPDGNDVCANGHTYSSRSSIPFNPKETKEERAIGLCRELILYCYTWHDLRPSEARQKLLSIFDNETITKAFDDISSKQEVSDG